MAPEAWPLQAGVARVTITPPIGATLTGFPHPDRRATHERDPLYATALVIGDDQARVALLCCDLQCLHPTLVAAVRERVCELTGIAPGHVMICCSHTHSGPACYDHPAARAVDRAYLAGLPFTLAGAVAAANVDPRRIAVRWGTAAAHVGINRRESRPDGRVVLGHNPAGPTDPTVRVARLDCDDGKPLALLVNYACHPVVLGSDSMAISADFVGVMRRIVEEALGAPVLFLQGACGDINPRLGPASDEGQVETLGMELAGAVLTACAAASPVQWNTTQPPERMTSAISAATARIDLPLLDDTTGIPDFPSREERRALSEGLDQTEPWTTQVVTQQAVDRYRYMTPIDVQMVRCGPLAIVGIPAEPFVEIGHALHAARPDLPTMVAGYTNGCVGYVPMPDAYPLGGYEVSYSIIYSRLPTPLAPECASTIIDVGRRVLSQ